MERLWELVDAGVGAKIWDALGRRGQDGHRALQALSRTVDSTTHLRMQVAYDQGDAFVVERYYALLLEMPRSYQRGLQEEWVSVVDAWAADAERALTKTFMRLAKRWAYLLGDCRAWQFMPRGLYHLWAATDAIDLPELMFQQIAIYSWKSREELRDVKLNFVSMVERMDRIAELYARIALGGEPATKWRQRRDGTILVRLDEEDPATTWELPPDPRAQLIGLTQVAMDIKDDGYEESYASWSHLTDESSMDIMDWGGDSDLRDLESHLKKRLAKITSFARPPALCPLLAEAVVEREMRDPHNDPEGCWTDSIAGYLVALANEALRRPRGWYTERDLRAHIERCRTPVEWRPALYDLWKRLDGVVRTDVPIAQRRKAVRRAETLFHAETEAIAAKVQ